MAGTSSFTGKVAVVTGGSGIIGSGIIRGLLEQGAAVVAPVRSQRGKESLQNDVDGVPADELDVPIMEFDSEEGAAKLSEYVKDKHGQVDYAVSCIGGWWQGGPFLQQPLMEVEKQLHTYALSHFLFAKAVIPLLKDSPETGYVIITGGAGSQVIVPGSSLVTLGVAAAFGVSAALRAETEQRAYRVNEVRLTVRVVRPADVETATAQMPEGRRAYPHGAFAGKVLDVIASQDKKGEVVVVNAEDLE